MARDILAEVKAHRLSAGHTAPLEPKFADALIRECERQRETIAFRREFQREREAHFAKALGIPDGGRYRNDWDAPLEIVREIAETHRAVRRVDGTNGPYNGQAYVKAVPPRDKALDALVRLLPEDTA
jgi:hypothetical protein